MNETEEIQEQPIDPIFEDSSHGTIGMYLKENEMYDILLRLKEYVDSTFSEENLPPQ